MLTKYQIIEELAKQYYIERLISKKRENSDIDEDLQDLAQSLYTDLLTKDEAFIQYLYRENRIKYYCAKMVENNLRSKSSTYARNKAKRRRNIDIDEIGELL